MPDSDALAISRIRAGDDDAFRELVERHGRAVFRVAYRITGRTEDAEDVVQETFLRAYRQLDKFEARANLRTWLHRIASNCAVDLLRARPKREIAEEPEALERAAGTAGDGLPPPDRSLLGVQIKERLAGAMALLTDMERAAFTLRHYEGLSIDEIAGILGLKTGAAKHSIFRAVRKVRRELRPFIEV
jgi:RNA polymerase sigma-70 factor, ECF subfamily